MKKMTRKVLCLLLAVTFLLGSVPVAFAARMPMEGREVLYGTIQVVPVGQEDYSTYRAARDDKNGIVYIHAEDFAAITGAQLDLSVNSITYSLGNWELHIRTDKGIASVYYDFEPNEGSIHGAKLYSDFDMTDCLHDELNDEWYLPMEEVMYMLALQWPCIDGTVHIYQPETLLDVMAEFEQMAVQRPQFEELMGEKWWQQWGNSFKWGVSSAIDELDMNFLWDGAFSAGNSALGEDFYSGYETDTLTRAILMLQHDVPANPDDAYTVSLDKMETFVSSISNTVELSGELDEVTELTNQVLQKCLSVRVPSGIFQNLAPALGVGSNLINYGLNVGQTVYVRDNLAENFQRRLEYLKKTAAARKNDDSFFTWLEETTDDAYKTYYGSAINTLTDNISLDMLANLIDNTLQLGGFDLASNKFISKDGGIQVLRWMNLAVSTIDLGIEVAANVFPPFASALEKGENAHLCRYLIYIGNMMEKDAAARCEELRQSFDDLGKERLTDTRTSLQLFLASSLHSSDLLTAIGKNPKPASGYKEAAWLFRLSESAKYDKLLDMKSSFSNIVSDDEGCMRPDIPVEYVRIIEPVIVTTESVRTESDHYYSKIIRPRVYSKANPKLGAAVDKVFDPIFEEAAADVKKFSKLAPDCKFKDAGYSKNHHDVAYLTSAYSNGHFLSLGLGVGAFDCSIGHNMYKKTTYVFDVASGALLDLPDLLNTKKDKKAETKFIALIDKMMDASGTRYAADHSPSDVTAKDMYEEMKRGRYAHWEIVPEGIRVSIEALNMDVMIHSLLLPFDQMKGILKDEYLPSEPAGAAEYKIQVFSEDMLDPDKGITVYHNPKAINALTLSGLATQLWIDNALGDKVAESIDGSCAYFYGFGVQNCLITLPEPDYEDYGYEILWTDSKGAHIENAPIQK